jgi:hypothetical protein
LVPGRLRAAADGGNRDADRDGQHEHQIDDENRGSEHEQPKCGNRQCGRDPGGQGGQADQLDADADGERRRSQLPRREVVSDRHHRAETARRRHHGRRQVVEPRDLYTGEGGDQGDPDQHELPTLRGRASGLGFAVNCLLLSCHDRIISS